jgi:4-amino-4-deoxy-L-arabinose transferase-like glycosyltransferase
MNMKKTGVILAVVLLSVIAAFWMLSAQTLNSHECFVSVAAREMIQKGDYVWPTLNGRSRLQKTPLCYWLVAGVGKITGSIDEFSARLPSAMCAFLSAMALFYYVNRWLSFRIAAISTAVWTTSWAYLRCSHSARPDMVMTFFVLLCMLSFYSITISSQRRDQIIGGLIFWSSLALGNLAKGPAPLAYVFVPLAAYILFTRNWKVLGKMLPVAGTLLFIVIVLPWPLFVAHQLNWNLALWKGEFVDRFFGEYAEDNYHFYFYLGVMFKYIMPWILLLPAALAAPFYRVWRKERPEMVYLWVWFVAGLIFLSIDEGKRQHYILPIIPAMAILIGILISDLIFLKPAHAVEFARKMLLAHGILFVAVALISPVVMFFTAPQFLVPVLFLGAIVVIMVLSATALFIKNKPDRALIAVFAGIAFYMMTAQYYFLAALDTDRFSRDFAREVARRVPSAETLVAYRVASSRFVQYYGGVVPEVTDLTQLQKRYQEGCWILCLSDNLDDLKNETFKTVYSVEDKDPRHKTDAVGRLFHKE